MTNLFGCLGVSAHVAAHRVHGSISVFSHLAHSVQKLEPAPWLPSGLLATGDVLDILSTVLRGSFSGGRLPSGDHVGFLLGWSSLRGGLWFCPRFGVGRSFPVGRLRHGGSGRLSRRTRCRHLQSKKKNLNPQNRRRNFKARAGQKLRTRVVKVR